MGRHCAGRVVLFRMADREGRGRLRPGRRPHRRAATRRSCLEPRPEGELIVLRLGSRTMPVLYTHLIPATFGGRARMNVANALAAAAAAWASGAHLHDIRQGLRTFSTSFFQAPGRLNLLDVGGVRVVIDYCHNVDGMRQLADFVDADDGRAADQGRAHRRRPVDGARRAGAHRRHRHPGRPARRGPARVRGDRRAARSTRSSSARTRTCAAGQPGETATNVVEGVEAAQGRRDGPGGRGPTRSSTS